MTVPSGPESSNNAKPAAPTPQAAPDMLSAFSEIETRMASFKALYAQCQTLEAELSTRQAEITQREQNAARQAEELAERERHLRDQADKVKLQEAAALEAMEQANALTLQLKQREAAAAEESQRRETELASRDASLNATAATLAERERKAAAAEDSARKIREAEQSLSKRIAEINQRQQQLKEEAAAIAESRRATVEQAAALERDRALFADQQHDLAVRTDALAADRLALETLERELTEQQQRIADQARELQARSQQAQRLAAEAAAGQSADTQKLAAQLADANERERLAREALAEQKNAAESLLELSREYEALWLLELEAGAERSPASSPQPAASDSDAELVSVIEGLKARLKAEIEARQSARQEAQAALSERDQAATRATRAEELLRKARAEGGVSPPAFASLERRRKRLRVYRDLVRKQAIKVRKAGEAVKRRYEQTDQILSQRAELAAARNKVLEQERRLASNKAVSRAAVFVLCAVTILGLLGGMSWAVSREIAPATFEATSVVKAEGRDRELSEAELHEWQKFHEETLADPRFHEAAAERFRRQGDPTLSTPAAVTELVTTRVTTESNADGELRIRLKGKGAEPTARTLETLTAGLLSYANSGNGRRVDGGASVAAQTAMAGAEPIDKVRTMYALAMFAGASLLALVCTIFVWKRLAGAKTAFEQDTEIEGILDEKRWVRPDQ
ncbi:MAG: hypothetical protein JSR77_07875 [Planctomycetes bacterium]|nr:hypothetical protein [Planctomycetota bacterium]